VIPLWVALVLGLGVVLAVGVALALAITLPRRLMRLVLAARSATEQARAESAAIRKEAPVAVAGIVAGLRAYHEEIAHRAQVARETTTAVWAEEVDMIVGRLRAHDAWLEQQAHAWYAGLLAAHAEAVETTRLPGHEPASRARPSPYALPPAPPGWSPAVAAGSVPVGAASSARPASRSSSAAVPALPQLGVPAAVPEHAPGRRARAGSMPTLVSYSSGVEPSLPRSPSVVVEGREGRPDDGGAT
jgi:hypothetical protein